MNTRDLVKAFDVTHRGGTVRLQWGFAALGAVPFRQWFIDCLNAKINRLEKPRGRKDDPNWRSDVQRLARDVNARIFLRERSNPTLWTRDLRPLRKRLAAKGRDVHTYPARDCACGGCD